MIIDRVDSVVGSARSEWLPTVPETVFETAHNAVEPVALRTLSGRLLVAAGRIHYRRISRVLLLFITTPWI